MAPDDEHTVLGYCGSCRHFEQWALGGGGDCHRGHEPADLARTRDCPDHHGFGITQGPGFDMSE